MIKTAKEILKEKGIKDSDSVLVKRENTRQMLEFITKFFEKHEPFEEIHTQPVYGSTLTKSEKAVKWNKYGFHMTSHKVVEDDRQYTEYILYYDLKQVGCPLSQLEFLGFKLHGSVVSLQ